MGARMMRPVSRTGGGHHNIRKDPGWQNTPGYRTPSKKELQKIEERERRKAEEQRKKQEASEKGVLDKFIDWLLRRK